MCGGVGFKIKNIPEKELSKFYSPEMIKRFKADGRCESFFWQKNSVLPVKTRTGMQLKLWGNKNENLKLPETGWAKEESLREGKWDYLKPVIVNIPIDKGCEKKIWFDAIGGMKGILVKRNNLERVYMVTKESSSEYLKETGHNREPVGEKRNYVQIN